MPRNVGKTDRIIRLIAGAILTPMAFVGPAHPIFFLGLVPLITGLISYCPAYSLFGFSTCGKSAACANCDSHGKKAA